MLKTKFLHANNSKRILFYMRCFIQSRSLKTSGDDAKPPKPEADYADDAKPPKPEADYADELPIKEMKMDGVKKASSRKSERPPFVKNLFAGNFDTAILAYAEIDEKERYEILNEMLILVESLLEEVDSEKMDIEGQIPAETLQGLKNLGVYGLQIPKDFGGLGIKNMEYARISEALALDDSIAMTLLAHQSLGLAGLLMAATDEQKRKYLPKLASGEWTAALCLAESDNFDVGYIKTIAVSSLDGKGFSISGTKNFVLHDGIANLMVVAAHSKYHNKPLTDNSALTLFLVERNFEGVSSTKQVDKRGESGSRTTEVHFDNTFVPAENVLGKVGDGVKLVGALLNSRHLSMGSLYTGILKDLLKTTVKHAVTCKQFGNTLSQFGMIKEKLAKMVFDIYAMESMTYLTAGFMDSYTNQDCTLELAVAKIFNLEKLWEHTCNCLQVLGGKSFLKSGPLERILRHIGISQVYAGSNDTTRLFIALAGFQHATKTFEQERNSRSLLDSSSFYFKSVNERLRNRRMNPKLDWKLHESLHPTLKGCADELEYCAKRFGSTTSDYLARQGLNVLQPHNQWNVNRMANIAIDLYAMTAVLGRASRSYCIGVHNCDQEIRIAQYFVSEASERIKRNLGIIPTLNLSPDEVLNTIADSMLKNGAYDVKDPLMRTF